VHRAATTTAVAGGAAAELCQHLVYVLLPLGVGPGEGGAAGVAVPVALVGAGYQVVIPQNGDGAHGHGLLASVEVGGTLDQVAAQQVVDFVLKHADFPHLPQKIEGLLLGQFVRL